MKKLRAQKPRPPEIEVILTMTEHRARLSTSQVLWRRPIGPAGDHSRTPEGEPRA